MYILADCPNQWGFWFQDPATPIIEAILSLHHDILFFLIIICVLVCGFILQTIYIYFEPQMSNDIQFYKQVNNISSGRTHRASIEIIWTLIPSWILMSIATPSFALLYSMDEIILPTMTLKVVGHQWYWSYEYSDYTYKEASPLANPDVMLEHIRDNIRLKTGLHEKRAPVSKPRGFLACIRGCYIKKRYVGLIDVLERFCKIESFRHNSLVDIPNPFEIINKCYLFFSNSHTYHNMVAREKPILRSAIINPYDSYLSYTGSNLENYDTFRLLDTDVSVILPIKEHIRVLVTSSDVLHSWAIPSFGIKLDACPGRLNQTSLFIKRRGVFYGQCSELCGVNHAFMPIKVVAKPLDSFMYQLEFISRVNETSSIEKNYDLFDSLENISRPIKMWFIPRYYYNLLVYEIFKNSYEEFHKD